MREIDRMADQFERACSGDAWYGPSARSTLEQVDARTATAHPVPAAHSICEIVLHLMGRIGDVRDPALGSGVTNYVTLHGIVQHHAYHAGRISLLKKAAHEEGS
jgi:hypothetical protein